MLNVPTLHDGQRLACLIEGQQGPPRGAWPLSFNHLPTDVVSSRRIFPAQANDVTTATIAAMLQPYALHSPVLGPRHRATAWAECGCGPAGDHGAGESALFPAPQVALASGQGLADLSRS